MFGFGNIDASEIDDINTLLIQAYANLVLAYSYIFEYVAITEEIQSIFVKAAEGGDSSDSSDDNESLEQEAENFRVTPSYLLSLEADYLSVSASSLALYGQTILTNTAAKRYAKCNEHSAKQRLSVVRSINRELYISAILEVVAYALDVLGSTAILSIKKTYPFLDV